MTKKAFIYDTIIGQISIAEKENAITNVFFGRTVKLCEYIIEETPLLKKAHSQLTEYLAGERKEFDLPLKPEGTDFEKNCWNALLTIPYGETLSYGQQAQLLGNPKACRAIGRANGQNPIPIFIPCHRVIGSNGSLTGFAGGLEMKQRLLLLEINDLFNK